MGTTFMSLLCSRFAQQLSLPLRFIILRMRSASRQDSWNKMATGLSVQHWQGFPFRPPSPCCWCSTLNNCKLVSATSPPDLLLDARVPEAQVPHGTDQLQIQFTLEVPMPILEDINFMCRYSDIFKHRQASINNYNIQPWNTSFCRVNRTTGNMNQ